MTSGDDVAGEPPPSQHDDPADGTAPVAGRRRLDGTEVLTLAGELDLDTVGEIGRAVEDALAARPGELVVDLSGVTFADSSVLNLLLRTHARTSLQLGGPLHSPVERLFEVTGITGVLNLHATVPAAVDAARAQR